MTREEKIINVRNIIRDYGSFTPHNVRMRLHYKDLGRGSMEDLESFGIDDAQVVTYANGLRNGSYYLSYDDLSDSTIDEILTLAQIWEAVHLGHGRWHGNAWEYGRWDNNVWHQGRWDNGTWHEGAHDGHYDGRDDGNWYRHGHGGMRHGGGDGRHPGQGMGHPGEGMGHPGEGHDIGHPGQGHGQGQGEGGGQGHNQPQPREGEHGHDGGHGTSIGGGHGINQRSEEDNTPFGSSLET